LIKRTAIITAISTDFRKATNICHSIAIYRYERDKILPTSVGCKKFN